MSKLSDLQEARAIAVGEMRGLTDTAEAPLAFTSSRGLLVLGVSRLKRDDTKSIVLPPMR